MTSAEAPVGPKPFARWVTVVGTLVMAAALVAGLVGEAKERTAIDADGADPLAAFDMLIARQPLDRPLAEPVAREAERELEALLAAPAPSLATKRGAAARMVVVLGERGRWKEAASLLAASRSGTVFPRVVACAYGPDPRACAEVAACDRARAAALAAYAGDWGAARACFLAARRSGDPAAAERLRELPVRFPRLRRLRDALTGGLVAAGLVAAAVIVRRRRRPRRERPPLAAPWSLGELYAALVRCLLWSLLVALPAAGLLDLAHRLDEESVGAVFYVAGFAWVVRLVFRRWGLSWRDSLGWPGGREIGVTLLAAVGLSLGGQLALENLAALLGGHVSWTDLAQQAGARAGGRLLLSFLGIAVLPPLVEELVFRRAILERLLRRTSPTVAILLTTLAFTLPHGYSPLGLAAIFWSGLVFAWAFQRTGNLWPGVAAHAVGNALALWSSLT
ncbi:MAG TPA: CPBP family intramembrane glutamic endopeptidase [Polyangia bacterium]|nr:CPBP family intramembrane glutamic endopeptidase [Polyangia bacterium]